MSEIKAGDLVMVVHVCCEPNSRALGAIFKVKKITIDDSRCPYCRDFFNNTRRAVAQEVWGDGYKCAPVSWLKKIDPPAIPETEERDEEVMA